MLKKTMLFIVFLILLVVLAACGAPKASPAEDFEYELKDGEAIIISYIGEDLEIVIPDTISNRPVTTIGESAFEEYDLVSVYIPDSVIQIEGNAFNSCTSLKSIRFSKNLEEIGYAAFYECESLSQVELPDSLKFIDQIVFEDCPNLQKIYLPDNTDFERGSDNHQLSPFDAGITIVVSKNSPVAERLANGGLWSHPFSNADPVDFVLEYD